MGCHRSGKRRTAGGQPKIVAAGKACRVTSSGNGGVLFPFFGWASLPLRDYAKSGAITFCLCGKNSGEELSIGFQSNNGSKTSAVSASFSSFGIKTGTAWTKVSVPTKTLVGSGGDFSIDDVSAMTINTNKSQTVYIVGMFITSPDMEQQHPVVKVNYADSA